MTLAEIRAELHATIDREKPETIHKWRQLSRSKTQNTVKRLLTYKSLRYGKW